MAKHAGFRRVVYNFGLSLRIQMYGETKCGDSKIIDTIKKVLTNHVKKRPEFAWINQLSSRVYQHAFIDLKIAFSRYRKGVSKHPTYASPRREQSFTVDNGGGKSLVACGSTIKIPTLGTFRLHEPLTESYITQTFNLVREGHRWYVSFCVDAERLPVQRLALDAVGIDVGVSVFATLSSGETFNAPKPLNPAQTKLAQLLRLASRQILGSASQRKTYDKIRRLHAHIGSIRLDFLHKLTTYLVKTFNVIKIEDLNVLGMLANHKLAGAISDLGFYEFKRQLSYKSLMYGSKLVLVDQWFPSSKTCSACSSVQPMPLSERVYSCPGCGMEKDRDLNASLNILNWEPVACGG